MPYSGLDWSHFSGKSRVLYYLIFSRSAVATQLHNSKFGRPRKGVSKVKTVQGKGKGVSLIPAGGPYHQPPQPDQIDQNYGMF